MVKIKKLNGSALSAGPGFLSENFENWEKSDIFVDYNIYDFC